ncbi:MAG: type II and III secretion system protein, partial [Alphaproteobacteria bacterium]|nr:type II and III secretion system protein [Alphaproteobacteria bacterium]
PATPAAPTGGTATGTGPGAQLAQLQQQLQQLQTETQSSAQARATGLAAQPQAAAAPAVVKGQGASWFSSNQQAGLVSVYGTAKQHKLVKEYLDQILQMVSAQVLIEAKVVEVTLTDQFRSGIDWTAVTNFAGSKFTLGLPLPSVALDGAALPAFSLGRVDKTGVEQSLLELVKTFGTVRTLSSPRLTVTNNQTAVLKVARNVVYFEINVTPGTTTSTGTTPATYSSEMRTVPEGVILTVQPSINLKREEVTLGLRPTITRVVGFKDDPAVRLAGSTEPSPVPEVEVREMDSVVTMGSGEVVVMGGLMQERSTAESTGIPGVMDVPLIGLLAKRQSDMTELVELVVIIKATILKNARDSIAPQDRRIYERFGLDPRPMAF